MTTSMNKLPLLDIFTTRENREIARIMGAKAKLIEEFEEAGNMLAASFWLAAYWRYYDYLLRYGVE